MKLKISGKLYDPEAGASKVTLQTLLVMQRDYGINMVQLAEGAKRMQAIKNPNEVFGDPEMLEAFLVMVWLARRYAGEEMTLEESSAVPIDELELVMEDGDEPGPVADPKEQTGSEADDDLPLEDPEPASTSKISKRRSTSTSRTSATSGQA